MMNPPKTFICIDHKTTPTYATVIGYRFPYITVPVSRCSWDTLVQFCDRIAVVKHNTAVLGKIFQ